MTDLKTNDILRLELKNGIVNSWEIEAFYYGAPGQESVIELTSMGIKPPIDHQSNVKMFVPANLIHKALESGLLTVFRPNQIGKLENIENRENIRTTIIWEENE
jgi:hypothetical protein